MRRVVLFAAFLLLLGLTTATAASFDVQAEDITSFSTEVDISVPLQSEPLYIRGSNTQLPGVLDPSNAGNNSVTNKSIVATPTPVDQRHVDETTYHAWESAADRTLYVGGEATIYLNQKGGNLFAAVFECSADIPSTDPRPIVRDEDITERGYECAWMATSNNTVNDAGIKEVALKLELPLTTIENGNWLRVKVANVAPLGSAVADLQWGFNPARSSQLEPSG